MEDDTGKPELIVNEVGKPGFVGKIRTFWSLISRWPYSWIFGLCAFVLVLFTTGGELGAGVFEWFLVGIEAFFRFLAFVLCFFAIAAIRSARKKKQVKGAKNFFVSLLTAVLFVWGALNGVMVPPMVYSAYNGYTLLNEYQEAAPQEFRRSIEYDESMPSIGDDALVIKELVGISNGSSEGRLEKFEELAERSMGRLPFDYLQALYSFHREADPIQENINARANRMMRNFQYEGTQGFESDTAHLHDYLGEIAKIHEVMEADLAELYGFYSWDELTDFVIRSSPGEPQEIMNDGSILKFSM